MDHSSQGDPIFTLQSQVGEEWTAIQQARAKTVETNARLDKILDGLSSTDAAIVVFGSLARGPEIREDLVKNHSTIAMEEYLRTFVQKTPLEILATFLLELKIKRETAVKLFSSYNAFLALLDDAEKRERLKKLSLEDIPTDVFFRKV